jgi:hypothetical protein
LGEASGSADRNGESVSDRFPSPDARRTSGERPSNCVCKKMQHFPFTPRQSKWKNKGG